MEMLTRSTLIIIIIIITGYDDRYFRTLCFDRFELYILVLA